MTRVEASVRMTRIVQRVAPKWIVATPFEQPGILDGVWAFSLCCHRGRELHREAIRVAEADLLHEPTVEAMVRDQLKEAA